MIEIMSFVWKTQENTNDPTKTNQVITNITLNQSKHASRAMRADFLDKYSKLSKTAKCVLRNIYKTLTGDASCSSCNVEKEVDERVSTALLELDDAQITFDL